MTSLLLRHLLLCQVCAFSLQKLLGSQAPDISRRSPGQGSALVTSLLAGLFTLQRGWYGEDRDGVSVLHTSTEESGQIRKREPSFLDRYRAPAVVCSASLNLYFETHATYRAGQFLAIYD